MTLLHGAPTERPRVLSRGVRLVEHLRGFGTALALVGPDGVRLTYAQLAERVEQEAATYAGARRLVLLGGRADLPGVVAYLGALAADQVVLVAGEATLDGLAAAYDPDVVVGASGRRDVRSEPAHELHPDLALLLSTSGSTGSPKLVRLSAESLVANAAAIVEALGIRPTDVAALTLPLHYCYGLSVLHAHLMAGAALLLTEHSVVDDGLWREVREHGVTTIPGVPHTFELLERSGFADRDVPSLRYLTQAGGRMAPDRVRRFAELGERKGFDLVVMYGQTEATARIAVLPPDRTIGAPGAIGLPVPGGSLSVRPLPDDEAAVEPGVGELVYAGPNVMLGYAEHPDDLALGRTVEALATGDLGRLRPDGLWEVVGRRGRVAKVLGLRIDLDRAERLLAASGLVAVVADGGDRLVLGVVDQAGRVDRARVLALAGGVLGLPPTALALVVVAELPRLASGKVDAGALVVMSGPAVESVEPAYAGVSVDDVAGLYSAALGRRAGPADTFVSLGGDSLSYVEVSLGLERLLGHLPVEWPTATVASLAADHHVPERRWGRLVEANVVLRAFAIVSIVGSHANLFTLLGGAHLLLAVAGFNLARFQLTAAARTERVRHLLRSAMRIAVPSIVVIATVSLWTDGIGLRQAMLVNGITTRNWSEPGWYYWFVEAAVYLVLLVAALAAVPAFDRLERRHPFWLPFALATAALVTRYGIVGVPGDNLHRAHVVFWLFALGWATARASRRSHRVLLSVMALATVPGFFDEGARDAYVAAGLLALIWVPALRLPTPVVRVLGLVAAASLWIYLLHWQVYPHLEHQVPWLATVLSLAVGVAAWWLVERTSKRMGTWFGNP
ncbi:AMP-binding protein [Nocardioides bigeumensis]|uniref:AMP-binding protein n=1 Tax=Nocardioides bigeumensis TaxID=433657 RepID=A0ABP5K8B8_9ACTN